MISKNAKLSIRTIPLERIQVNQYEERDTETMLFYLDLLKRFPKMYAGIVHVEPSKIKGMYSLLEGHRRFCASIMAGRPDALCVVIEEEE
jgi:hypothetical protein